MLNFRRLLVASIFLAALSLVGSAVVKAEEDLSSDKMTLVKQNCVAAQITMQRIKYNDAAIRVNRGQGYETLFAKLMTPLNSRTAANGYNNSATKLTEVTARYQQAFDKFKKHYEDYDDSLSSALQIKCHDKPNKFYGYVSDARRERANLAGSVAELRQLIDEYNQAVMGLHDEVR